MPPVQPFTARIALGGRIYGAHRLEERTAAFLQRLAGSFLPNCLFSRSTLAPRVRVLESSRISSSRTIPEQVLSGRLSRWGRDLPQSPLPGGRTHSSTSRSSTWRSRRAGWAGAPFRSVHGRIASFWPPAVGRPTLRHRPAFSRSPCRPDLSRDRECPFPSRRLLETTRRSPCPPRRSIGSLLPKQGRVRLLTVGLGTWRRRGPDPVEEARASGSRRSSPHPCECPSNGRRRRAEARSGPTYSVGGREDVPRDLPGLRLPEAATACCLRSRKVGTRRTKL